MRYLFLSLVLLLTYTATAKTCTNITVPIHISARNGVFNNIAPPVTNLDATTCAQNITQQGRNFTQFALTGYTTVSGQYNISTTLCVPDGQYANSSIQILTHGIGFDKSYWDLSYENYSYSYVDTAVDGYGYSTLSYDRLGIGASTHAANPNATLNEIQSFLEIASLAQLTKLLRSGTFPSAPGPFSKVIHIGHSFGAAQSYALTAMYPGLSDGLVLTGFSLDTRFVSLFGAGADFQQAHLNQPLRFGSPAAAALFRKFVQRYALVDYTATTATLPAFDYTAGYLTNSNANALQYLFFQPGNFDEGILYAAEQGKQPVTEGELLTLGSIPASSGFQGPVMVFTGSSDLPYCGGNCLASVGNASSIPALMAQALPQARAFQAYIQPDTGHGLNFHYNATAGFRVIQDFLKAQGL